MIGAFIQVNTDSQRATNKPVGYIICESGCWEWVGRIGNDGYGKYSNPADLGAEAGIYMSKRDLRQRLVLATQRETRAYCERTGRDYDWNYEEVAEHLARCFEEVVRCVAFDLGEFEEQIVADAINNLEAKRKSPRNKDEEA